ncbi:hypothetical protein Tco_1394331 [Tanacetum coccineum]
MFMTIQSSVKDKILGTLSKASKECEIRYHPGKANRVADALSRKDIWYRLTDMLVHVLLVESSVDKTLSFSLKKPSRFGDYKGKRLKELDSDTKVLWGSKRGLGNGGVFFSLEPLMLLLPTLIWAAKFVSIRNLVKSIVGVSKYNLSFSTLWEDYRDR